jgi:hypothetical protein
MGHRNRQSHLNLLFFQREPQPHFLRHANRKDYQESERFSLWMGHRNPQSNLNYLFSLIEHLKRPPWCWQ